MTKTKGEIVSEAYAWLGISGITTEPTPGEVTRGLNLLEKMAREFDSRNICTNFNYEDSPAPTTESGIDDAYTYAAETQLGIRLAPYFGKELTVTQRMQASGSLSNWAARTSVTRRVPYPSRMPKGRGNLTVNRYFPPVEQIPVSCKNETITQGEINTYTYSLTNYLRDGETVSSHTYEASAGLTVTAESLPDGVWSYTVECSATAVSYQSVTLTVTTSTGRRQSFKIVFECKSL